MRFNLLNQQISPHVMTVRPPLGPVYSRGMQLALIYNAKIAVRARNAAIMVYIDTAWSTKLVKAITTLFVELLPCFPAQSPPASDSKTLPCGRLKSLTLAFNKPLDNAKATHDTY